MSESNRIFGYDELVSWINSIQGVMDVETLWFLLFGTWDDKKVVDELVHKIKTMFGIDFQNYHKHGFVLTLLNHALRKIRKMISNSMSALCGMTLQKSTETHTK